MSKNETYNGWANYATWRVNLEMLGDDPYYTGNWFADHDIEYEKDMDLDEVVWRMAQSLEESVNDFVELELSRPDGIVVGWVRAFLSDVDWCEIARHFVADWVVEQE